MRWAQCHHAWSSVWTTVLYWDKHTRNKINCRLRQNWTDRDKREEKHSGRDITIQPLCDYQCYRQSCSWSGLYKRADKRQMVGTETNQPNFISQSWSHCSIRSSFMTLWKTPFLWTSNKPEGGNEQATKCIAPNIDGERQIGRNSGSARWQLISDAN